MAWDADLEIKSPDGKLIRDKSVGVISALDQAGDKSRGVRQKRDSF